MSNSISNSRIVNNPLRDMLTVVIPTRNRPHFFARLLAYYRDRCFESRIVFADSSDPEFITKTRQAVSAFGGLNIDHRLYNPDASYASKISDTLGIVDTPFTALGADDDFLIPSGVSRAVQFLQEHSDYALAHGDALAFELESGAVFGPVEKVNRYEQRTIDQSTAIERLTNHFSDYSTTYYSVHRTEELRQNFLKRIESETDLYFGELLPSALSLIQGKAKKLDGLYIARQGFVVKDYEVLDVFDWIASPGWGEQYGRFRDCLAKELNERETLEIREARKLIKEVFVHYLSGVLKPSQTGTAARSALRPALRAIPGVRPVVQALRSLDPSRRNEINLPALLSSSSPYHADFMPIYRAITEPSEELVC